MTDNNIAVAFAPLGLLEPLLILLIITGSLNSLYEEPGFSSEDKKKVYDYAVRKWRKYEET